MDDADEQAWLPATGADLDWCHELLRSDAGESGGAEDPEDPSTVQAMPVVLHLPRQDPPSRTEALEAAATAVARFCLDRRVAPGGPWHEEYTRWMGARMRKISRRARGAGWLRAGEVPGLTARVGAAEARAIRPGPVAGVDERIGRLQIGGTDLPADDPGDPAPGALVVWLDAELGMSTGKAAAQVCHGVMLAAAEMSRDRLGGWTAEGTPVAVRFAGRARWAELRRAAGRGAPGVAVVRDAGYTEVAPGSLTVVTCDPGGAPARR